MFGWRLFLAGIALCLSGCCFGGGAKITPVDPALVTAVVLYLRKKRRWKFGEPKGESDDDVRGKTAEAQRLDRHRGMFVRRRVELIGAHNADLVAELQVPGWETATTPPRIVRRVEVELDLTEAYFRDKIGTPSAPGPLAGGPTDLQPPHLDLDDVARMHTGEGAGRRARYTLLRKQRAIPIIWRAAGLHDEIWEASADRTSATMRRQVIDELVDRRLRPIERMAFQVSNTAMLGGRDWKTSTITDGDGPWKDGFRIRPFEYPRLQKSSEPISKLITAIGASNIAAKDTPGEFFFRPLPGETTTRPWRWAPNGKRLEYNATLHGLHFPPRLAQDFEIDQNDRYRYTLIVRKRSGRKASAIVDDMFLVGVSNADREDFWQRCWVYCDHCVASLLLEGLRFGLLRRTTNDNEFDRILSENDEGKVAIGPFSGERLPSYFEYGGLPAEYLQVGDHTIFWNSHLYLALTIGDWRLEHSLVMDVDGDPVSGRIRLEGVHLQGHGIGEKAYRSYQRSILVHVTTALQEAQALAERVGVDPNRFTINYAGQRDRFVRWSPYEPFKDPGAWWVFVHADEKERFNGLLSNPHVVRDLPPPRRGQGYIQPPFDGLYFPLFTPRIKGGWAGYLAKRQMDPTFKPPKLDPMMVDASIIPGIYVRGVEEEKAPVTMIRPKARK